MKLQRVGKIVNIATSSIYYSGNYATHYITSKAGLIGLTKSLAHEVGSHGINVNSIAPGFTKSLDDSPDIVVESNSRRVPLSAIARDQIPSDLVGSMIFLLCSDSDFMSGQTLVVDGGTEMI